MIQVVVPLPSQIYLNLFIEKVQQLFHIDAGKNSCEAKYLRPSISLFCVIYLPQQRPLPTTTTDMYSSESHTVTQCHSRITRR